MAARASPDNCAAGAASPIARNMAETETPAKTLNTLNPPGTQNGLTALRVARRGKSGFPLLYFTLGLLSQAPASRILVLLLFSGPSQWRGKAPLQDLGLLIELA